MGRVRGQPQVCGSKARCFNYHDSFRSFLSKTGLKSLRLLFLLSKISFVFWLQPHDWIYVIWLNSNPNKCLQSYLSVNLVQYHNSDQKKQSKLSQRLPSHKKKASLTSYNTIYVQIFPLAFKKNVAERFGIRYFPKWKQAPQNL